MATLCATATAHPPHRYEQDEVIHALPVWLERDQRLLALAQRVFENAAVQTRYGCRPLFDLAYPLSLTEMSQLYQRSACALGEQVTNDCLTQAKVTPETVNLIISTSCTGFMIPSLDVYLVNHFGFSPHVKRLPVTELGCAAGAMALARAYEYLRAFPHHTVLVVAVELPSLTFQLQDLSAANVVSSALFGDGAAAVLLNGERQVSKPQIIATESTLFPHTTKVMGFELKDSGFHIVLSTEIPELVRAEVPGLVARFLGQHGYTVKDMSHFLLHPGGRRVLEGLVDALDIPEAYAEISRMILRDYGNLSSAAVLFILDQFLRSEQSHTGDLGLLLAFGPGFSAETILLRWA
jgi:alkylresorcinol/alkylpyrone synthase